MNSSGTLKIARNGYIVMAVVFCALGIFLMAVPEKAVKIICVLAGILFIADGIIKIIGYFSRDFYCLAFQFDLGFGILMIAVGILILVRREAILRLIFVIFGLVILTDALLRIQMSVEAKKFGLKLWWAVLLIAVATGIFGAQDAQQNGENWLFHRSIIFVMVAWSISGCSPASNRYRPNSLTPSERHFW